MTRNELIDQYFDWMYQLVVDNRYSKSYRKLFARLHDTEFTYTIPEDGNRAEDGIDLRYRSVLEMMTALALRIEEHIMDDPDIGNRTGQWFWGMLVSLGLGSMYDAKFDRYRVDRTLERLLEREYERNGEGGLFTVNNGRDMRTTEIWYQMNYYLSEIIREGSVSI